MEAFTAPGISTLCVWCETIWKRYHTCMSMTTTTPGTCSSKLVSGRSWNVQLVEVEETGLYRFRYVRWTCCASIISPVTRCFSCVSSDQLHVKCFFSHWYHKTWFSVSSPLISLVPQSLFQQGSFWICTHHTCFHILSCRTTILQKPSYFCHV